MYGTWAWRAGTVPDRGLTGAGVGVTGEGFPTG